MKLFLMPHEPSWWVWAVNAVLLAFGISGHPEFFLVAIVLSGRVRNIYSSGTLDVRLVLADVQTLLMEPRY